MPLLDLVPRLTYIGVVIGLLLVGAVVAWWSISRPTTAPPPEASVAGLSDSVTVRWTAGDAARITASSTGDALAAIGFVHGISRPWTISIWRRAALGHLSRHFGRNLAPLDRHARRLAFARHARSAYRNLTSTDRNRLQAYARGLNAALRSDATRHREPFVFFDSRPEMWEPWHPLAVARLLAWMGTDVPDRVDVSTRPHSFLSTDRLFRRFLHLHGWDRSVAWATRSQEDSLHTTLYARHVLGDGAEPVLQELRIRRPQAPTVSTASLPGTLLFPTGASPHRSWAYLLDSPTGFERVAIDSNRIRDWYERISPADADEQLVRVQMQGERLVVNDSLAREPVPQTRHDAPTSLPDSSWVLRWPGLTTATDLPRWLQITGLGHSDPDARTATRPFSLFSGTGLTMQEAGRWRVEGRPRVVEENPSSILVGQSSWARHQGRALEATTRGTIPPPDRLSRSDSSTWAAELLPNLLPDLRPLSDTAPVLDDALPYLRNWNFRYGASSIGAVLFERWMQTYRRTLGRRPSSTEPAYFAKPRRRRTFQTAVNELVAEYGSDVRRWRWERVAANRRHFLIWSADSLVSRELGDLRTTRFAPLERPGRGHASTLAGGPALVDPPPLGASPTQWTGWSQAGSSDLTVRRLRFDPSAFFARSLLEDDRPDAQSLAHTPAAQSTKLVPATP